MSQPDPSPPPSDLRALRAAATPGEWAAASGRGKMSVVGVPGPGGAIAVFSQPNGRLRKANAVLTAAAVNNLLPLLDRAEAAEADNKRLNDSGVCEGQEMDGAMSEPGPYTKDLQIRWLQDSVDALKAERDRLLRVAEAARELVESDAHVQTVSTWIGPDGQYLPQHHQAHRDARSQRTAAMSKLAAALPPSVTPTEQETMP